MMSLAIRSWTPFRSAPNSIAREPGSTTIWDGVDQAFTVGPFRQAMIVRDLTPEGLAAAAGVSRGTVYNALQGKPVRLRTARLILEALASVPPTLHVVFALTDE